MLELGDGGAAVCLCCHCAGDSVVVGVIALGGLDSFRGWGVRGRGDGVSGHVMERA